MANELIKARLAASVEHAKLDGISYAQLELWLKCEAESQGLKRRSAASFVPDQGLTRFEDFWRAYPALRRTDKIRCQRLWVSKKLDAQADELLAAMEVIRQRDEWERESGRFVPLAGTFLQQDRWLTAVGVDHDPFGVRSAL